MKTYLTLFFLKLGGPLLRRIFNGSFDI